LNIEYGFVWFWESGLVVSSPPATKEIGAMGREIKSRQCSFKKDFVWTGCHSHISFSKILLEELSLMFSKHFSIERVEMAASVLLDRQKYAQYETNFKICHSEF
jgi:hypothetical protein